MTRLLLSFIALFIPLSTSALTIKCTAPSKNGFGVPLGKELYNLERILEDDGSFSFSLSITRNLDGLPLESVGVVRTQLEEVVFGASLKMHKADDGFITHVVGIPKKDVHEYKFYVSFSERKEQCPEIKSFYVSFGT